MADVWKLLNMRDIIEKACLVDRAGEAIPEHLLCLKDHDIHILGLPKLREVGAIAVCYLWYKRRKSLMGNLHKALLK